MTYKLFASELSEQEKYGIKGELFQNAYASVKVNVNDIFDFTAYLEMINDEPQLILPSYYDSETGQAEQIIKCSEELKNALKEKALQSLDINFITDVQSSGNYTDLKASTTIWTKDPLQSKVQFSVCDNDEILIDNLWIIFNETSFEFGYYYRSTSHKPLQSTFLETLAVQATVAELVNGYNPPIARVKDLKPTKKFKTGDRVYHKNLEQYGTFIGYAWESNDECDVEFQEDGYSIQKHVSVNKLILCGTDNKMNHF